MPTEDVILFQPDEKIDNESNKPKEVDITKIAPWASPQTLQIKNPVLRFHNEIIDFCNYIAPTEKEHQIRINSFNMIKGLIHKVLPDVSVKSFGSFETKLYLPNADIDLVVIKEDESNKTLYQKVAEVLSEQKDVFENINFITHAKVPLIKFVEKSTQISFDISFNKEDGVKQLKEVEKGLKIYPEMKYLIYILKCMLRQRELHETYQGGIGSFLLFCMILTFLRAFRKNLAAEKRLNELENVTLGEYLLKFFEFYAIKNDWSKKRVIMNDGGDIIDKNCSDSGFSLISPQDIEHDIGKSAYRIKDIFNVFKNRYLFLTNYNFQVGESIVKYLVNPSNGVFLFLKEEDSEH